MPPLSYASGYATSKIGLVSSFFFLFFFLFSHTYKSCYKTRTRYPIALKFGTQKGGIKAHLGTNFGWNTINMQSYERLWTKNNTDMLSRLQGKPRMGRS